MGKRMSASQREDPEWYVNAGDAGEESAALLDVLGKLPIFETLTWNELEKIERIVHRRYFALGEMVIRAWTPRSGLFVVLSGSVNVVRHSEDGTPHVLGHLGQGELLGEFAILDDSPRSTSIVASERCELIGFFRPDLMDLIQTDPRLGFKILYRLSQILGKHLDLVVESLRKLRKTLQGAASPANPPA